MVLHASMRTKPAGPLLTTFAASSWHGVANWLSEHGCEWRRHEATAGPSSPATASSTFFRAAATRWPAHGHNAARRCDADRSYEPWLDNGPWETDVYSAASRNVRFSNDCYGRHATGGVLTASYATCYCSAGQWPTATSSGRTHGKTLGASSANAATNSGGGSA